MFRKIFRKSEFARNVATLVTGTAIAQAIPILISPILTRLYSPEDFGVFALYLSIASVIAVIATGRYEFAITLPPKDEDAVQIVWLSGIIVFCVALVTLGIVLLFHDPIVNALGNERIGPWLYFIPLTIVFSGGYQIFNYWFNRQRAYAKLSKTRVLQTTTSSSTNLIIGFSTKAGATGLVLGNILGQLATSLYFLSSFLRIPLKVSKRLNKSEVKAMAKRYKDFPIYDAPASFCNIASNQITHIFFNSFFSAVISGHYYLVQKIFNAPINLLAGAVQDVFKMEIVTVHNDKGDTRGLFLRTLKKLFLLAVIPTLLIYFFAEDVFTFVFGKEWSVAGKYVKILTPVFFIRFLSFPLSYMLYVAEKQKYNALGQFLLVTAIVITFLIGRNYEAETVVKALSVVYFVFYTSYLYISYTLTSKGT
ncbi:MAG: oligosaccharide flippase family protein [Flavobacteriaceae bacterium]|nr:oligosaccharide flippase family protein [Flavobacteriaceae bacterium]